MAWSANKFEMSQKNVTIDIINQSKKWGKILTNIYDTANQLERELREVKEFQALTQAYDDVKADSEAYNLFKEFQTFQQGLQEKQMQGEEFTEEDAKNAQEMAEKVQQADLINQLMEKEQAFSMIVNDLNRIIMTPIRDMYNS